MKSNVKVELTRDVARLRMAAFSVLGFGTIVPLSASLASCKTSTDTDGLVVVPMLETLPSASAAPDDGGAEAARLTTRPILEPHAPNNQTCTRDVECAPPLATPPSFPFAHPYERCDPSPLGSTGHFSARETDTRRQTDPDVCCYLGFNGCTTRRSTVRGHGNGRVMIGRPLRDADGAWITAEVAVRGTDEERAVWWAESGAAEHASVAEFARLSLVLMGLGAPSELLEDVHHAALDEIAHARTCFEMASRLAGRAIAPGPLDVSRAGQRSSLRELVMDTLRDGCLGESAAALELTAMARATGNADIAAMARDEERHALLAWRIISFAMTRDERVTRDAISEFLATLDVAAGTRVEHEVARAIVGPCAELLLA